jgi:hypothetical protein
MELGSRPCPGTIKQEITSTITFKGYAVHTSKEEPRYLIKSDITDLHKGSALKKLRSNHEHRRLRVKSP